MLHKIHSVIYECKDCAFEIKESVIAPFLSREKVVRHEEVTGHNVEQVLLIHALQ